MSEHIYQHIGESQMIRELQLIKFAKEFDLTISKS